MLQVHPVQDFMVQKPQPQGLEAVEVEFSGVLDVERQHPCGRACAADCWPSGAAAVCRSVHGLLKKRHAACGLGSAQAGIGNAIGGFAGQPLG